MAGDAVDEAVQISIGGEGRTKHFSSRRTLERFVEDKILRVPPRARQHRRKLRRARRGEIVGFVPESGQAEIIWLATG